MYLLQWSWKRLMLCSFTVTTYLGMANGSEMQWPNWACSQKQPLSKTLLGIFTVMVRGYAAALLSSGLCLADNKTCSMYCKLGICCNTPSEADPLKTPGSVEVVGEAGVPCTAFATLLLSTASDCFGAASAAAAAAAAPVVQSVGVSFLVASGPPDMLTVGCTDMPTSTVFPVFALFLCMGPLGNCSASALFLCKGPQGTCS